MPDLSWKKKSYNAMEQLQKELSPVRNRISSLRLIKLSRDNSDRLPIEPIGEPTTPLDKIFNKQTSKGRKFTPNSYCLIIQLLSVSLVISNLIQQLHHGNQEFSNAK